MGVDIQLAYSPRKLTATLSSESDFKRFYRLIGVLHTNTHGATQASSVLKRTIFVQVHLIPKYGGRGGMALPSLYVPCL